MATRTLSEIKALFETGDKPTGKDFIDLIDTLNDTLAIDSVQSNLNMHSLSTITAHGGLVARSEVDSLYGPQGDVGAQGPQGVQGTNGINGSQGPQGLQGVQGQIGSQGAQGAQGMAGINGINGSQGPQGDVGAQGPQGAANNQTFELATISTNGLMSAEDKAKLDSITITSGTANPSGGKTGDIYIQYT